MNYWWVNQNQTYKHEIQGGYMWSPKTRNDGVKNQYYINMSKVSVGDVVFSYYKQKISAIGVVKELAITSKKPIEFNGIGWNPEGWLVVTDFTVLKNPISPKDHISSIKDLLPEKYSPLQKNGNGKEFYLTYVEKPLAEKLIELLEGQVETITETYIDIYELSIFEKEQKAEKEIYSRTDINETEKMQLVKARIGQSLFKSRVRMNEVGCRVTGILDIEHLRAGHIKPWADSNDKEKLDGNNGLLLSPHIDHLFDRGYISFSDEGTLLISPKLNKEILKLWTIDSNGNFGSFNQQQKIYLAYHRQYKFLH